MLNKDIQTTCDIFLASIFEQAKVLQESYRTEDVVEDLGLDEVGNPVTRTYQRGKYFQLITSHSVIPADGVETAPDLAADSKPTDQVETLATQKVSIPALAPCAISISPYQSPKGWGFTLTAQVVDKGVLYQRVMNFGDEVNREVGWAPVSVGVPK